MTVTSGLRRVVVPLVSAVTTTALLSGALWIQHVRGGWPFPPRAKTVAPAVAPAAMPPDMAGMTGRAMPDRVPVDATPSMQQTLGVRIEQVGRESLTQTIQAVATVAPDESRISHAHTRVAGWVEQLDVNTTGELVRAGQPLARIFSQELLSSQTEYLAARRATSASGIASAVIASGRTRLTVLGMSEAEVSEIEQTGQAKRLVTVVAPRSGVVVNRGISVGTAVDPSTPLLTIADLSRVWVLAEVPEAGIPAIRMGSRARLEFPASGREPFVARVDFLYPTLTERTRTLRVRFSIGNPSGTLRPGLYGNAIFELPGATTITVPRDAVVDTGREQHVFVSIGDRFEPRPVTIGVQLADRIEILSGLTTGERIVAAGVFLLDSESRLRATGGMGGHAHGASSTPKGAAAPSAAAPAAGPAAPPAARPATPPAGPHTGHRE
ncbi:efflux RND transporter periplasmic adaptor subunit [Luteitalea sp.]